MPAVITATLGQFGCANGTMGDFGVVPVATLGQFGCRRARLSDAIFRRTCPPTAVTVSEFHGAITSNPDCSDESDCPTP